MTWELPGRPMGMRTLAKEMGHPRKETGRGMGDGTSKGDEFTT